MNVCYRSARGVDQLDRTFGSLERIGEARWCAEQCQFVKPSSALSRSVITPRNFADCAIESAQMFRVASCGKRTSPPEAAKPGSGLLTQKIVLMVK
ncbi:hypothetical protein RB195_017916 [Necator americanus]|uniref:Uncharacterized protein n=1 Tax=Necator americanus TaxID=51031 RepID=A0ABR1CAG1_NECAM